MSDAPLSIRPTAAPQRTIDLTRVLTAAVAHELWQQCGGNESLNWLEAERFIHDIASRLGGVQAPADAHEDEAVEIERKPETRRRIGSSRRAEGLPRLAARAMAEGDGRIRGPIPLL